MQFIDLWCISVIHMKKAKKKIGQAETRKERFRRLASKRTNEILQRIRIMGNCSNRSSYDYSEAEITKIFSTIEKEMRTTRARFTYGRQKEFKL